MRFPISGVTTPAPVPFLVAMLISLCTSTAGVSGAFLLMPFQVSFLGFVGPAVTPTNHLFNVLACPSGIYRYIREGRMVWHITAMIIVGTVPGVVLGSLSRIYLLPDTRSFKLFMGLVLVYIGSRMVKKVLGGARGPKKAAAGGALKVHIERFSLRRLEYSYQGEVYGFPPITLMALTIFIGVVGGAYGVGGGSIIAPVLVSLYGLPVHTIAGATLMGTFCTSVTGVIFFTLFGRITGRANLQPDWLLGVMLGAGGVVGMYLGARAQKFLPARAIEILLAMVVTGTGLKYVVGFFL